MKLGWFNIISIAVFIFSININAEEISGYDTSETGIRVVKKIFISGNNHTKHKVIINELPFTAGSFVSSQSIKSLSERARENLLNTTLFNYVSVNYWFPNDNDVIFDIKVEERWYIWVFPIFEQEGRNFSDFLRLNDGSYFNYGLYFKHDNLRGRNETLKLRMVTGHKNQLVLGYENPGYNNRSGWGVNLGWLVYDQVPYTTNDDKQVFLKALGEEITRQANVEILYFYRHNLDHRHWLTAQYIDYWIADTLKKIKPDYLPKGSTKSKIIELGYKYQYDTRDSKVYPLEGSLYEAEITRRGIGLLSDYNGFFQGKIITAWHIPLLNRFYGSTQVTLSGIDRKEVPYVFKTGLGYNEYLNGFEFRVIDGSSFSSVQNKLLFELVPRKEKKLTFIPIKQFSKIHYAFYLKLQLDGGYVVNKNKLPGNFMANSLLIGYGVGLDLVTFYDKVLSINYSANNFSEHGIFVHFNLAM